MNRTDRLYALVEELRRASRTSAWLAERFEVSTRTIKRDIAALLEAGVPVASEDGRGGGYRLLRSATLPPLTFTAGEATAIAIALSADPRAPFMVDGHAALTKVLGAMTGRQRAAARDLAGRVWMRFPPDRVRSAAARLLDEALRLERVVHLDYEDAEGRHTMRRPVEPLAFARTGGSWYLLAWCRWREAGRWFRLDRVRKVTVLEERATPRPLDVVFGAPPDDARPVTFD